MDSTACELLYLNKIFRITEPHRCISLGKTSNKIFRVTEPRFFFNEQEGFWPPTEYINLKREGFVQEKQKTKKEETEESPETPEESY